MNITSKGVSMNASRLPQSILARRFGYSVVVAVVVLALGGGCGKSPTVPPATTTSTTSTTTVPATTTTTSSTTTTVPANTTTTTSIAVLDAFISVQNTPCVAPSSGAVSCTFAGSASGGRTPYTFR